MTNREAVGALTRARVALKRVPASTLREHPDIQAAITNALRELASASELLSRSAGREVDDDPEDTGWE